MTLKPQTYRSIVSGRRKDALAAGLRAGLALLEYPYRWIVNRRNRRYDQGRSAIHRIGLPVISVGNVTMGGTGKTPMVAWLAQWFLDRHVRVALISRGYGARTSNGNDEFKELAERLPNVPHVQDSDRIAAARLAIDRYQPHLVVLDDAFQHRRIARDLDVVLIDATEPFGYDHVFPRGMLREPAEEICRADVVVLTRCDLVSDRQRSDVSKRIRRLAPRATWVEMAQRPASLLTADRREVALDACPPGPWLAFCGIGNPDAFRQSITRQGWPLEDLLAFPDHHAYDPKTLDALRQWVASFPSAKALICTHKDLVKIGVERIGNVPVYAMKLELEMSRGRLEFEAHLNRLLDSIPGP